MNTDRIEGNWKQIKGRIQKKWGKLTNDELDVIDGDRQRLLGRIQEIYGIKREVAEKELNMLDL
ncbi:MAG: CsbD family protein [Gammaproteobacteria bacterium]|nr:CsbD family protein [Gammaproteobacteria bacterium]